MKIFIIIIFQLATQYGLYDKYSTHQEHIGNLSIDKEIIYLHMKGYKPDAFKIVFRQFNHNSKTYYIENDEMKGYILLLGNEISIEVVPKNKNKTIFYKRFYTKWKTQI